MATKLGRLAAYLEGLLSIWSHELVSGGLARSRDNLKSLHVHFLPRLFTTKPGRMLTSERNVSMHMLKSSPTSCLVLRRIVLEPCRLYD